MCCSGFVSHGTTHGLLQHATNNYRALIIDQFQFGRAPNTGCNYCHLAYAALDYVCKHICDTLLHHMHQALVSNRIGIGTAVSPSTKLSERAPWPCTHHQSLKSINCQNKRGKKNGCYDVIITCFDCRVVTGGK